MCRLMLRGDAPCFKIQTHVGKYETGYHQRSEERGGNSLEIVRPLENGDLCGFRLSKALP